MRVLEDSINVHLSDTLQTQTPGLLPGNSGKQCTSKSYEEKHPR